MGGERVGTLSKSIAGFLRLGSREVIDQNGAELVRERTRLSCGSFREEGAEALRRESV